MKTRRNCTVKALLRGDKVELLFGSFHTVASRTGKNGKKSEELKMVAGRPVCIKGHYLTFDIDDEKQGVFISDGAKEIRDDDYYHRGTEYIDFFVPSPLAA